MARRWGDRGFLEEAAPRLSRPSYAREELWKEYANFLEEDQQGGGIGSGTLSMHSRGLLGGLRTKGDTGGTGYPERN